MSLYILLTYLFNGVQSALAVAFINIRIPLLIGGLVNVLSKYAGPETASCAGTSSRSFMDDIKQPALQLISMYALQVISAAFKPFSVARTFLFLLLLVLSVHAKFIVQIF